MKVRDAMAKTVSSAMKSDRVIDIARKMKQEDAGFIPVVENGGTMVGVITDRDIVIRCIAEGHDPRNESAEHVMSREVTIIGPDDDIEQAARMMEREEIRRLPVAENGRLVGVLSHGNLVQATKNKTAEKATEGVTRGA
ncbi:MAG: CBS domain-containing protein [Chloroflexi bacterium]|nr:MAG: CBS domain-containing protein [Chloroflexota bacterium]TME84167.1 MAG: CBS domain-containing protein [Chloroflexota bacterium]